MSGDRDRKSARLRIPSAQTEHIAVGEQPGPAKRTISACGIMRSD